AGGERLLERGELLPELRRLPVGQPGAGEQLPGGAAEETSCVLDLLVDLVGNPNRLRGHHGRLLFRCYSVTVRHRMRGPSRPSATVRDRLPPRLNNRSWHIHGTSAVVRRHPPDRPDVL